MPFGEGPTLLVTHEHDFAVADLREPGPDRTVVPDGTVAVKLNEFVAQEIEVIDRLGAVRVPGDEDGFPRRQVRVAVLFERRDVLPDTADLLRRRGPVRRLGFEPGEGLFEFVDVVFEWQRGRDHGRTQE